MSEVKN